MVFLKFLVGGIRQLGVGKKNLFIFFNHNSLKINPMKSILVLLYQPRKGEEGGLHSKWQRAAKEINSLIEDNDTCERISDGVVLIPSGNGLSLLGPILSAAQDEGVRYKVLFLEKATMWEHIPD